MREYWKRPIMFIKWVFIIGVFALAIYLLITWTFSVDMHDIELWMQKPVSELKVFELLLILFFISIINRD